MRSIKKRHRAFGRMQWFTACVSTTLVLLLLGMVVLIGMSAHQLSQSVRENLTVTLMLDDDLTDNEAAQLALALEGRPYVRHTTLIGKVEALREQTEAMGTDPSEFLGGENPFTATIEMNVIAEYACTDSLLWIAHELKEMWQVQDVVYQRDLVDNLNRTLGRITLVLAVLAVLLMIISVVLINNTVRLSVYSRRFTIHTMRLVGASWSFISRPFLTRSLGIGLVSASMASGLLIAGIVWGSRQDAAIGQLITPFTIGIMLATVFACGLLLTLVCTWLSVSHFLRMRENEMYK